MRGNVVARVLSAAYVVFLTALLLTADPMRLIGARGEAIAVLQWLTPIAHLLSFFVLTVLSCTARWPAQRWVLIAALIAYGGLTEFVQGFLPPRTPDCLDWLQDVAGVLAGAAFCWACSALIRGLRARLPQEP